MEIAVQPYDIKRCPNEVSKLKNLGVIKKTGLNYIVSCDKQKSEPIPSENKVFYVKKRNMSIPIIFSRSTGRFSVECKLSEEVKRGIFTPYNCDLGRYDEFARFIEDAWEVLPTDWEQGDNSPIVEVPNKVKPNNLLGNLIGAVPVGTIKVDIRPYLKEMLSRADILSKVLMHRVGIL